MFRYSVIIPTYNEQSVIRETLSHLTRFENNLEIIISDGGSSDRTVEYAEKYFVKVVVAERGRGNQLNLGAKAATGDILIFLHADTKLPETAFDSIERMFAATPTVLTTFRLRFNTNNIATKIYSYFSRFDSIFTTFGDQAIICRRSFFDVLGGFKNYKIFEDVELLRRTRKLTKINKIESCVETSSRRYEKRGFVSTQFLNLWFIIRYLFTKNVDAIYNVYFLKEKFTNNEAVIVFIKYPEPGKVKTRLAETTGDQFAKKFYEECVRHTIKELEVLSLNNTDIYVFYDGNVDSATMRQWIENDFHLLPQTGTGLGDKMVNAFKRVFENGYHKVAIVGSDIPDLSADLIKHSLAELETYDAVISPSPDGGYNLMSLKKMDETIFSNIHWSTSSVMAETVNKLNSINYKYCILKPLMDIDTEKDLIDWLKSDTISELKDKIENIYTRELTK